MTGGLQLLPKIQLLRLIFRLLLGNVLACAGLGALAAAELGEGERLVRAGNYARAITMAEEAVRDQAAPEEWHSVLIESLLASGRYDEANTAMAVAMGRHPSSIRLRWLAREVALRNGEPEKAASLVQEIRQLVSGRAWFYRDAPSLVVFGRVALLLGADPKDVLEKIYATAQRADPKLRDVYLARGELALEKHDAALAATAFQEGLKAHPEDADLHFGVARAFEDGERAVMLAALDAALKTNPRHVPSLLLMVDHRIDAEDYAGAEKILDDIAEINAVHPDAWAARAIIAHLKNSAAGEKLARDTALQPWPRNPRVDHLIGKKLSAKYRFAEGAAYQRQALRFDPDYLPAQAQLASDLLRLGDESEGWRLAQTVHEKDGYDVEAYNLVTLHETMAKYETLSNSDFVVRMTTHESKVYGPRVLELLTRAKRQLTTKYGVTLATPTIVEIFADPKDFAVRTFGLPDVPGFLGVCFGRVVTANSPAAGSSQVNWESVLWHEFCHVVTLQMTANKMPRWLSEGISVYEERQASSAWGMRMTPRYREMILGNEMVPVGSLSAAFLAPKTPMHLQFAYFQSSLVVEFIIERYGLDRLKSVLQDLRTGEDINRAIAAHTAPLPTIEKEFTAFAKARADELAPQLEWEQPPPEIVLPGAEAELAEWLKRHPNNYWALMAHAGTLTEQKKWAEAQAIAKRVIAGFSERTGAESAYRLLAATHRALEETEQERAALAVLAEIDDEATDAHLRLMELAQTEKDWPAVALNAQRYLGINPLVPPPYRHLARASEETGDLPTAISAYRTLLELDPPNPADANFRLAKLLHAQRDRTARRYALQALEDAPRFRAALDLLLDINSETAVDAAPSEPVRPAIPPPSFAAPPIEVPSAAEPAQKK